MENMCDEQKQSSSVPPSGTTADEGRKEDETADDKILRLEAELSEANDKYLRLLAEMQNLMKRQTMEKEEFIKYANEEIISEFLSVYDHLNMSINFLPEAEKKNNWVAGVEHTIKQFKNLLLANGVEEIKTVGENFNPNTMEAMADSISSPQEGSPSTPSACSGQESSGQGSGEKVAKEVMPGYKLSGKVIRAARVTLE